MGWHDGFVLQWDGVMGSCGVDVSLGVTGTVPVAAVRGWCLSRVGHGLFSWDGSRSIVCSPFSIAMGGGDSRGQVGGISAVWARLPVFVCGGGVGPEGGHGVPQKGLTFWANLYTKNASFGA